MPGNGRQKEKQGSFVFATGLREIKVIKRNIQINTINNE